MALIETLALSKTFAALAVLALIWATPRYVRQRC